MGIASVVAGAFATVIEHAKTAQKFSGVSAAATGIRAEYDQSYFNQLLINTIEGGISKKRREIRDEIEKKAKGDINTYGVNQAVKDARRYHASCNIIAGLKKASAIDHSIGLKKFQETTEELRKERLRMLKDLEDQEKKQEEEIEEIKKQINGG